jgi:hypothetical protein
MIRTLRNTLGALVTSVALMGTPSADAGAVNTNFNADGVGFDITSNEGNLTYSVEDSALDPTKFQINFFYTNPFATANVDSADLALT